MWSFLELLEGAALEHRHNEAEGGPIQGSCPYWMNYYFHYAPNSQKGCFVWLDI